MSAKEKYYIKIQNDLVEVTREVYLEYYRAVRRERAQKEKDQKHGVLSYDALDAEGRLGSELLSYSVNIEDLVSTSLMCEKLHQCLAHLPAPERELLFAIYFDELSERELHARSGVPQTTISYRKRKALAHLKNLLQI